MCNAKENPDTDKHKPREKLISICSAFSPCIDLVLAIDGYVLNEISDSAQNARREQIIDSLQDRKHISLGWEGLGKNDIWLLKFMLNLMC